MKSISVCRFLKFRVPVLLGSSEDPSVGADLREKEYKLFVIWKGVLAEYLHAAMRRAKVISEDRVPLTRVL
jgi:hypothetical protein